MRRPLVPSGLLLLAALLFSVAAAQSADHAAAASWQWLIEWLRVIGGLLGMIVGGIGIWVYFKVTSRQKTAEVMNSTVEIYKEQGRALETRMVTMEQDYKTQKMQADERERELIILRSRTDLTEVLKALQMMTQALTDLIAEARKHDDVISVVLKDAMATGAVQYKDVMDLNNKILIHMDETSKQGLAQTMRNYDAIERLVTGVNSLSRRFGKVEDTVQDVAEQVGVDAPVEEKEVDGRRRKDSR